VKKTLFAVAFVAMLSLAAMAAQAPTNAKAAAKGPSKHFPVTLAPPHACTFSKAHPCVYYGGDLNLSDPNQNGLANENSLFISGTYSYTEVKSPVSAHISGSFTNDLQSYPTDPATCTWAWRTGVSEGNGGTLIGSGDSKCITTPTGRSDFGFAESENLTATSVSVPAGNVWFTVIPDCQNSSDGACSNGSRSFGTTTDGTTNAINGTFSVKSAPSCPGSGFNGPVFDSSFFGVTFTNWCNTQGLPANSTMSYGVLR
jgi:hypothetical protein